MAASKCPKCAHEIEVRDGRGELLPLARCSTCDSFYPARLGECRWCGTKPERASVGPYVWKGVGIATFVAMGWGAWLVRDDPRDDVAKARLEAVLKPDSSAAATDSTVSAGTLADDVSGVDSAAQIASTDVVPADTILQSVATLAAISDSAAAEVLPVADTLATSTAVVFVDSAPPVVADPIDSVPAAVPVAPREPTVRRESASRNRATPRESVAAVDPAPPPTTPAVSPRSASRATASRS